MSPLITEIKLAKNCIKSGTTGSYCGWSLLSLFNNFISISTSDNISWYLQLGKSVLTVLRHCTTSSIFSENRLLVVMLLQPWWWVLEIQGGEACRCNYTSGRSRRIFQLNSFLWAQEESLLILPIASSSLIKGIISFCRLCYLHNEFGFFCWPLLSLQHSPLSW